MSEKESASLSVRGESLLGQGSLNKMKREVELQQEWDEKTCPKGMLNVAGATNLLMGDFWDKFFQENSKNFDPSKCEYRRKLLADGTDTRYGPENGSTALTAALAAYFNRYFHPACPLTGEEVLVTNGSSSLIENLAWSIFDAGDAIILPTPTYALFAFNLQGRADVKLLRVPMGGISDQFHKDCASEVIREFRKAYDDATSSGIKVRGLLICNPNNPFGRCYSRDTLLEMAKFCNEHNIHFISDEVYGMSSFDNQEEQKFDTFTSALAIPSTGGNANNIHVLYSASKDFGMGGMRLGFLVTRNEGLREMIKTLGIYSWVTHSSGVFFTRFISDADAVHQYLTLFKELQLETYNYASGLLKKHKISFSPANAGLFLWLDLRQYLKYFEGSNDSGAKATELDLCSYLIANGIFLSPGETYEMTQPGYFRFTTSFGKPMLEASIQRLSESLESLIRNGKLENAAEILTI